jgi:hypothetical protein
MWRCIHAVLSSRGRLLMNCDSLLKLHGIFLSATNTGSHITQFSLIKSVIFETFNTNSACCLSISGLIYVFAIRLHPSKYSLVRRCLVTDFKFFVKLNSFSQ